MRVLFACCLLCVSSAHAACDADLVRKDYSALRAQKWQLDDAARRQALVLRDLDCLASPDPVVRDQLVFESLFAWSRAKQLDIATLQAVRLRLLKRLEEADAQGFAHPFAALGLAEVARADRVQPFLSTAERDGLLEAAVRYEKNVRDYRGFDEKEGWRHGVAHGADWLLQLALNPALGRPQLDAILDALAAQAAPSTHAYIYREGERLAAPLFYIARRNVHSAADWDAWCNALTARLKEAPPDTQAGLALRHNLSGLFLPLYFMLQESQDAGLRERLLPAVARSLKAIG